MGKLERSWLITVAIVCRDEVAGELCHDINNIEDLGIHTTHAQQMISLPTAANFKRSVAMTLGVARAHTNDFARWLASGASA